MSEKQGTLFTVGEFAKKAGVTERTIRFYDKIGLLKPSAYKDSGHRLYSVQDFARLQKILTLKYIGLSLDDIAKIVTHDIKDDDFKKSLEIQRNIIDSKVHHMNKVADAIDETLNMLKDNNVPDWDKFINIINAINTDVNWLEQYQNSSNLRARIRMHELFSTNNYGWMRWYFDQMNIPESASILEVGCGDCSLWVKNIDRIVRGWDIILTDFSDGMLKDGKNALGSHIKRFKFAVVDVQNMPYADNSFDVVIANHMLYHVHDMEKSLSEIYRVLKPNGYLYASTIGKEHMKELKEIVQNFAPQATNTPNWNHTEKFQLENGIHKLSRWFTDVKINRYEDSLMVTDSFAIIDYLFSKPGNLKEILSGDRLQKLMEYLNHQIESKGAVYITKDTGFFEARKPLCSILEQRK